MGLEILLLAHHAALDTACWRATRWFMGDQDAYKWTDHRYEASATATPSTIPWYCLREPPMGGRIYHRTEGIWRLLRDGGEPYFTVFVCLLLIAYHPRGFRAVLLLLAAAIPAGLTGELLRDITGRLRPDGVLPNGLRNDGENIWHFLGGFTHHADLSFPSGHAVLVFTTATVLWYLSPRGRWLFIPVAVGCAIARVVMQAHFYSDVLMSAEVGVTTGWICCTVFLDRLKLAPHGAEDQNIQCSFELTRPDV